MSSRVTDDVYAIELLFADGLVSLIVSLFKIIGILVSIFVLDYWLGLSLLVIIPLIALITRLFQKAMKEALSSVLSYMFSVGYLSCYAETDERNAASRGLLEKLGFAYEGLEENHLIEKKNEKVNLAKYRLAKEAFTCR